MKTNNKRPKTHELNTSAKSYENAQTGLYLLKSAILDVIEANPEGIKNSELTRLLGLESDFNGNQRNYLTYSVLGLLIKENRVYRDELTKKFRLKFSQKKL